MKALHLYASRAQFNSGDFFLGPATKWKFEQIIKEDIEWKTLDVRHKFAISTIEYINRFDYLVLGGGGLILPDSNPNNISCWQWAISEDLLKLITAKIYVMSIGYNLFFEQDMSMPYRDIEYSSPVRLKIFKSNIETLIDKSHFFSMRHNGDIKQLQKIVDSKYHSKIEFMFCPVIDYVKEKHLPSFNSGDHYTFEIKDDRPNRRYKGTSQIEFYDKLKEFIEFLKSEGKLVAIMSHDGSSSFRNYLKSQSIDLPFFDNTCADEEKIISNYAKVKKLYCMAGHSQMTGHALEIEMFSLISHNKLKYFLEDIDKSEEGIFVKDITLDTLKQTMSN